MNVARDVKFDETEATRAGNVVHKLLDKRVKGEIAAFPPGYEKYESIARVLIAKREAGHTVLTEQKLTLNRELKPTGFFSPDAWVRSIIDAVCLKAPEAWLGDWKTGKIKVDSDQLRLSAAVFFAHYPDVERVRSSYVWLGSEAIDGETYYRGDLPRIWPLLLEEPARLQAAADANDWPARPSRLCRWCAVNKARKCESAQEPYRE